jgi:hypothetical protein
MQNLQGEVMDHQMSLMPSQLRALQQAASSAAPAEVTYVGTASALQAAISEGARHIQITEHLDLSAIEIFLSSHYLHGEGFQAKFELMVSTWSIRVRPSPCLQLFADYTTLAFIFILAPSGEAKCN